MHALLIKVCKLLVAIDEDKAVYGAKYFVYDDDVCYYLLGGNYVCC